MLTRIHVNRHTIASNKKKGSREAPLTAHNYKEKRSGHTIEIFGGDGNVAATVVYRPEKPLKCGATVWIESSNKVEVT